MFPQFSSHTFTEKLCKIAFRKTGLILFNPSIVLDKMKEYGGIQEAPHIEPSDNESDRFATPPPILRDKFNTPVTNTGQSGFLTIRNKLYDYKPYCGRDGSTLPSLEAAASGAHDRCTGIGENYKL
jgi:hypothetical protein